MTETSLSTSDSHPNTGVDSVELEKLRLEQARYRADVFKWIVVAVGASRDAPASIVALTPARQEETLGSGAGRRGAFWRMEMG